MFSRIIKKIHKFTTINTSVKIIAVMISLVLWIFVASSQSNAGKFPGKIPIKMVNLANGLSAIYDQKEAEIEIMAKPSAWNKLSSNSFSAFIDMEGLAAGTYEMNLQVQSNVSDIKIISKKPTKLFVRVEEVVQKRVVVNQRVEGSGAEGFVAGNVEFLPTEIDVRGPKSVVDNISEVVAIIRLNGESDDFEKEVEVRAFDNSGEEITDVTFNPNKVKAQVTIVEGRNNKSVGIKTNLSGSPADGYYISKITTTPNLVNITGQSSVLQVVNYLETQNIDISGVNSDLEKEVLLKIPDGIALQQRESNKIKIQISFSENSISKTVTPKVEPQNLAPNLKFDSPNSSDIKVTLSGRASIISAIDPKNVVLNIDFSGKVAGTFSVPLVTNMINPIDGVTISSVSPASVFVAISPK